MVKTKEAIREHYGPLFSAHIRELRESRGLTQRDLAGWLGVSRSVVAGWESRGTLPALATALLLAEVLGVGVESLLGGVGRGEQLGARLGSALGQDPLSRDSLLEILEIVVAVLELPREGREAALGSLRMIAAAARTGHWRASAGE